MSKFRPCQDFFVAKDKILMSMEGIEKLKSIKIDGEKLCLFFQRDNESPNPEYSIWCQLIEFPSVPQNFHIKLREYENNAQIIEYLNAQTNQTWRSYYVYKTNVFPPDGYFGGVPSAEMFITDEKVESVIEIAHSNRDPDGEFSGIVPHCLRLALYLSLRKINTGWLCLWKPTVGRINLSSSLKRMEMNPISRQIKLGSKIEEIGDCRFGYTVLERWENQGIQENKITLLKIRIDLEKMEEMKLKINGWFGKYQEHSPTLSPKQINNLLIEYNW